MANATLEDLTKKLEDAETKLKALGDKPDYSGVYRNPDGSERGHFEDTDEEVTIVSDPTGKYTRGPAATRQYKSSIKRLAREYGYKPRGEFKSFADFIRFGMENRNSPSKIESRVGSHLKAIQGLNTTDGASGGFTVMPEFANGILERMYDNDLWSKTDSYNVSGNSMTFLASAETSRANGSRAGGMQGYWLGEGQTITKSKPTIREVNLKLNKLAILVYLTDEMLADTSMALEQRVTRQAAAEFTFLAGDSLINGTSVGMPMGWLNSPNLISIAKETGQDARTIQTANVENMYSRFFAPFLPGAVWYHHQDIQPQLDTMTLGLGLGQVPVYLPPGGMSAAPYGMLKGRPMQPTEFNATLGTQGDLMLCDMGQMLSITKGGIQQAVSIHVEFLTDQTALRFTMRLSARPWENSPITPYKGSNTQSSCVVLDTRA